MAKLWKKAWAAYFGALSAASILPRDGAAATSAYVSNSISPAPTKLPTGELFKRDALPANVCGWAGGNSAAPVVCPGNQLCVRDNLNSYVGCCPIAGPCTDGVFTLCTDADGTTTQPYAKMAGNGILSCTGAQRCYTNIYEGGYLQHGCGAKTQGQSIATTYTGQDGAQATLAPVITKVYFNPGMSPFDSAIAIAAIANGPTVEPTPLSGAPNTALISSSTTPSTTSSSSSSSSSKSSSSTSSSESKSTSSTSTSTTGSSSSTGKTSTTTSNGSNATTAAAPATSDNSAEMKKAGIIAGSVVGGVAFIAAIVALILFCCNRRRVKEKRPESPASSTNSSIINKPLIKHLVPIREGPMAMAVPRPSTRRSRSRSEAVEAGAAGGAAAGAVAAVGAVAGAASRSHRSRSRSRQDRSQQLASSTPRSQRQTREMTFRPGPDHAATAAVTMPDRTSVVSQKAAYGAPSLSSTMTSVGGGNGGTNSAADGLTAATAAAAGTSSSFTSPPPRSTNINDFSEAWETSVRKSAIGLALAHPPSYEESSAAVAAAGGSHDSTESAIDPLMTPTPAEVLAATATSRNRRPDETIATALTTPARLPPPAPAAAAAASRPAHAHARISSSHLNRNVSNASDVSSMSASSPATTLGLTLPGGSTWTTSTTTQQHRDRATRVPSVAFLSNVNPSAGTTTGITATAAATRPGKPLGGTIVSPSSATTRSTSWTAPPETSFILSPRESYGGPDAARTAAAHSHAQRVNHNVGEDDTDDDDVDDAGDDDTADGNASRYPRISTLSASETMPILMSPEEIEAIGRPAAWGEEGKNGAGLGVAR